MSDKKFVKLFNCKGGAYKFLGLSEEDDLIGALVKGKGQSEVSFLGRDYPKCTPHSAAAFATLEPGFKFRFYFTLTNELRLVTYEADWRQVGIVEINGSFLVYQVE